MKRLFAFLFAFICIMTMILPYSAKASSDGYWKMSVRMLDNSDPYNGEYWKSSVSAGQGGASFTTRGAQNEYEKTSTSWTEPPERIEASASFEINLTAKVDALTNRTGSHVSTYAYIDVPGLGIGTFTGGTQRLTDSLGTYACETLTESASMTVSGSLGTGSASGEQKAVYIESYNNGLLVQSQYIYTWIVRSEGRGDSGTRFSSISGTVEVASDEDFQLGNWHFAKLDEILPVNAHIRTGEESSCILSFSDMSTFVVKEETHIVLNAPPDKDNKLALVWGKIKANVKKMMKDGSMEIDMSQAVAGIKGTTFVCEEDGETSTLKVFEGTVAFTAKSTGETVMVETGQQVSADASGLSPVTAFDTAAEDSAWANLEAEAASDTEAGVWSPGNQDKAEVQYGGLNAMAPVLIGVGIIVLVVVILIVVLSNKKRRSGMPGPIPPTIPPQWPAGVQGAALFCSSCGNKLTPASSFCDKCGRRVT